MHTCALTVIPRSRSTFNLSSTCLFDPVEDIVFVNSKSLAYICLSAFSSNAMPSCLLVTYPPAYSFHDLIHTLIKLYSFLTDTLSFTNMCNNTKISNVFGGKRREINGFRWIRTFQFLCSFNMSCQRPW